MRKIITLLLLFACGQIFSQHLIIKKNGDEIKAKVEEITETTVKYKAEDNLDGPIYNIAKTDVFKINYGNGKSDFFGNVEATDKKVEPTEKKTEATEKPMTTAEVQPTPTAYAVRAGMPVQGSKVFIICDNSQEDRVLPHLKDRIKIWGYWRAAETKEEADFFIEQVVNPKPAPVIKGYIIVKKKDGSEIARSSSYVSDAQPWNGMSHYRGLSVKFGRWLKGEKE